MNTNKNPMAGSDGELVAMAALRYAINRQTGLAHTVADWLLKWWWTFNDQTRVMMLGDIVSALMRGEAGDPIIDAPKWMEVAQKGFDAMNDEDKKRVRQSVAHVEGVWPLKEALHESVKEAQ